MKGLNLAGFKKLKEDKKMVTMGHPSGHTIMIAKSAVSPLQRKQLEKLPVHMANAGIVGDPNAEPDEDSDAPSQQQAPDSDSGNFSLPTHDWGAIGSKIASNAADAASALAPNPSGALGSNTPSIPLIDRILPPAGAAEVGPTLSDADPNLPGKGTPVGSGNTPNPNSKASPMPSGSNQTVDIPGAYQQGLKAIGEERDLKAKLADADAPLQQQKIQDSQALNDDLKTNMQAMQKHNDDFAAYNAANPIDPKHYVENMGAGQKVATALGLIFGGLSGGLNHTGVNPASEWLNNQINRDIQGQRERLDQQKTVLGANQSLYNDQIMANNATRINMNDLYDQKMKLAATKLGTPQAQQAYDDQSSQWKLKNAQLLQQNAIRGTVLQGLKNGSSAITPRALGMAQFMTPEEAQKEQASVDKQNQSIATAKNIFTQLNDLQKPSHALWDLQTNRKVAALHAQLLPLVQSEDPSSRLSDIALQNEIAPFQIGKTDSSSVVTNKLQGVLNLIKQKHAGETPNTGQIAPQALPNYNVMTKETPAPQGPSVGDIRYIKGQKVQIVNAKGDYKPVK